MKKHNIIIKIGEMIISVQLKYLQGIKNVSLCVGGGGTAPSGSATDRDIKGMLLDTVIIRVCFSAFIRWILW